MAKREAIDKQEAFIEFKSSEEGQQLETNIHRLRQTMKDDRHLIKQCTHELNESKQQID